MSDPDEWDIAQVYDDIEFTLSPIGRIRREDREVAYALAIVRLRGENAQLLALLKELQYHGFRPGGYLIDKIETALK